MTGSVQSVWPSTTPSLTWYSKHAILGLMRSIALDFGSRIFAPTVSCRGPSIRLCCAGRLPRQRTRESNG